ncbi:DinB family protein [uncultured Dokdonia sp.]|uniref:DinB family protein n=1 Tax=uncultured Dokdonia sp. TaxID=575653 RepID=UPI00262D601F|nr:DinB family protein [uncultured Dokdonia sp.]
MLYDFDICQKNRQLLHNLIEKLTPEQLNKIPEGYNNNILWNIGHSIATQQLLVYGLSGEEIQVPKYIIDLYKKGTKPEKVATLEEIDEIKSLLFSTIAQLEKDYKDGLFKSFKTYTLSTSGGTLHKVEDAIAFNNFHEGLHLGYALALIKAI